MNQIMKLITLCIVGFMILRFAKAYMKLMRLKNSENEEDRQKHADLFKNAYTSKPVQIVSKINPNLYSPAFLDKIKKKFRKK